MANQWNEKFINNQLGQLITRKTDDTNWKNKDLPSWTLFNDITSNQVTDSLNQKFGTDWTIIDKSFTENDSKYVVFAGNYSTGGFLLFTTKVFDEVYLFTEMQTTAPNRVIVTIPINHIYDFENDLYGQIFLITDNLDNKSLQIISNPFVTDDIDLRMLLLTHNIVFDPATYETIKWKTDAASQNDWNNFCQGIEWKLAIDISKQEYSTEVIVSNYYETDFAGTEHPTSRTTQFVFNYVYSKDDESNLRKSSKQYIYLKEWTTALLDIKWYDERLFITTNIATSNVFGDDYQIQGSDKYVKSVEFHVAQTENHPQFWHEWETFSNPRDDWYTKNWNDLKLLTMSGSQTKVNLGWIKDYYDWLKKYNGYIFQNIKEDISFFFASYVEVLEGDNPTNQWMKAVPYLNGQQIAEYYTEHYSTDIDHHIQDIYHYYKVNFLDWVDNDNKINVQLEFKQPDGSEIPDKWVSVEGIPIWLVKDLNNIFSTGQSELSQIIGDGLFVDKNLTENVSLKNEFTQTLYLLNKDSKLVTTTFTVKNDGTIDIQESEENNNIIHQVDYSTTMFNVPSMINDKEMFIGFITQQKYPQIDYLLWHYEKIDPDKDDTKVVLDGAAKSINPLEKESTSIFTYYLKNEVIYQLTDIENVNYIGLLYLKNDDRISNIIQLNTNQKLFFYFKDDNSIQLRSIGDNNNWAELPYTNADETSIYFREEQDNQIDNFNLTRIGLLQNNFSLSDNNISNKNMKQVSAYVNIAPEMMNYAETNKISLINNNNVKILISDLILKKNQWENDLVGFNIKIKTNNEWKNFFNDPDKFQLMTLKIGENTSYLLDGNFSTIENKTLKIGFKTSTEIQKLDIKFIIDRDTLDVDNPTATLTVLNYQQLINLQIVDDNPQIIIESQGKGIYTFTYSFETYASTIPTTITLSADNGNTTTQSLIINYVTKIDIDTSDWIIYLNAYRSREIKNIDDLTNITISNPIGTSTQIYHNKFANIYGERISDDWEIVTINADNKDTGKPLPEVTINIRVNDIDNSQIILENEAEYCANQGHVQPRITNASLIDTSKITVQNNYPTYFEIKIYSTYIDIHSLIDTNGEWYQVTFNSSEENVFSTYIWIKNEFPSFYD